MYELVLDVFLQHVDQGFQQAMEGNKSGVTRFALRVLYTSIVGKSVVAGSVASEMQVDSGMSDFDTNPTNIVHTASDEAARADTEDEDAKFDTVANLDTSLDTNVQAASDAESSVDTFDTSCGCSNLGSDTDNRGSLQAFLDDAMFNLETEKNAHNRDSSLRVHKHGS